MPAPAPLTTAEPGWGPSKGRAGRCQDGIGTAQAATRDQRLSRASRGPVTAPAQRPGARHRCGPLARGSVGGNCPVRPRSRAPAPRALALSPPTPCHLRPSASQPRAAARALPPVRGAQTPWGWARLPTYRTRWGRSPQPLPGRAVKEEMEISGSHQLSTFAALTSPVTPGSSHACSHTHTRARAHPRPLRAPGQTHNTRRRKEQKERGGGGNIQ